MLEMNIWVKFTDEDFDKAVEAFDEQELYTHVTPEDALAYTIGTKFDSDDDESVKVLISHFCDSQRQVIIREFKKAYLRRFSKILDECLNTELE